MFVYLDDWLKPYQDTLPQQPAQASHSELQGRTRPVESVPPKGDPSLGGDEVWSTPLIELGPEAPTKPILSILSEPVSSALW